MKEQRIHPPALGIAATYLLFFLLFLFPVSDFLSAVLPMQFGSVQWRYGSVGMMGAVLASPVMAIGFSMILAFLLQHRTTLRILSMVCFAGILFLMLAMISMALDVVQLWQARPAEGVASLKVAGAITEMKLFSGALALTLFGFAGWIASRRDEGEGSREGTALRPPGPALKSERPRGQG